MSSTTRVAPPADRQAPDIRGRRIGQKPRDELIFALRGVSMFFVPVVHMGFSVVASDGASAKAIGRGIGYDILSWGAVWVVPTFFLVAGALSRWLVDVKYWEFLKTRGVRLLAPYYVFAAVMLPIEVVLWRFVSGGPCEYFSMKKAITWILPLHEDCLGLAQGPMWFLAVFIPIALAAPLLVKVWDSRLRWVAPAVALAFLAVFDVLLITTNVTHTSVLGADDFQTSTTVLFLTHVYLFWALVFYLGFAYADGYVQRLGRKLVPLGLGCAAAIAVMVVAGPYPANAFGTWWAGGNQFPPTLAWFVATLAALFLFTAARESIAAWGQRRLVRPVLKWFGERSLTILLWHMIAYTILYWCVRWLGLLPTIGGLPLLVERVFWYAFGLLLTVPLVNLFYPVEKVTVDSLRRWLRRRSGPDRTEPDGPEDEALPDVASIG